MLTRCGSNGPRPHILVGDERHRRDRVRLMARRHLAWNISATSLANVTCFGVSAAKTESP